MATIHEKPSLSFEFHLKITEEELKALHEISSYGAREVATRLVNMAPGTLDNSKEGLMTFFAAIQDAGGKVLSRVKKARESIE
jgi:hypothetical protein